MLGPTMGSLAVPVFQGVSMLSYGFTFYLYVCIHNAMEACDGGQAVEHTGAHLQGLSVSGPCDMNWCRKAEPDLT